MKRRNIWLPILLLISLGDSRICWASEDTSTAELVAVGDVMLSRAVQRKIEEFGPNYPFQKVCQVIREADVAFCNLECAITLSQTSILKRNVFGVKPEEARGLSFAGFDIVSLGNNHALDRGRTGLSETMESLTQQEIQYVGAGRNYQEANMSAVLNLRGLKVGFLAYCLYPLEGVVFREDAPSVALYNPNAARKAIEALREEVDVIVVSLHWGDEYHSKPNSRQIRIAHQLIDAGADLILGHHPHVLQPIEEYKGGVIVYSLGNFVFDQRKDATRKSVIFSAKFSRKGVQEFSTMPVQIIDHRPCLLKEKAGKEKTAAGSSTEETD